LGGRYDVADDIAYWAALDTVGQVWIIGNPGRSGEWVAPQSLIPPATSGPFGLNTSVYMCGFSGTTLLVCDIDTAANWISAEQFSGNMPVRAMYGYQKSLLVIDGNGFLSRVGLPTGGWVTDIPQYRRRRIWRHPHWATLQEVMGTGYDDNGDDYIAALDTDGFGCLIGKPTGGGQWVEMASPPIA
jgi:hypothetical protein